MSDERSEINDERYEMSLPPFALVSCINYTHLKCFGFIDRSTIAHASIRKLSSVQKIGPSIAKKIKEQAKTIL